MGAEATQIEGGDLGEDIDMPCGQLTEGETGRSNESSEKELISGDKEGKDNPIDMQAMLACIKEMFREESNKMAKKLEENMNRKFQEYNESLENMFVVNTREMLSSMNHIASEVEQRTDRKIEAVSEEISLIVDSTNGQFRALTEEVQKDKSKITSNFVTLREEMTASHAQVAKQSENSHERVNS
jgi:glutamate-1-semialdehyde aminotransferase